MRKSGKRWLIGALSALCATTAIVGCAAAENTTTDAEAPKIVLACNDSYLAALGSKFAIPVDEILVMDNVDEVSPVFSVQYGEEDVAIKGNKFAVEKEGTYTITVKATDTSNNTSTATIAVHTTRENEINSFDDQIRIDQTYTVGYAETSLNVDEKYIKDGTGSLRFRVLSHEALGWPRLVVDNIPINDIIDYYSVSFWAYNDGTEDVEIYLHRNDVSAKAKFTLPAKTWTKVEVVGRNYDAVFQYVEASSWGEPECGMCEDMKCFTFHIVNPANSPQYDIYVDSLQVNPEKVYDTLDISAKVKHPTVGVEYEVPTVTATLGQETVDADVTYAVFDNKYNQLPVTDGKITFTAAGKYTLTVEATYGKVSSKKNYMLVCAPTRAENEIEFFEYDTALNFVRSEHYKLSLSDEQAQGNNASTKSLKIGPSAARWGYLTLANVPYADLEDVSYIWFYAKTDAQIKDTETPYIGIRDGGRNKVLKRMTLTNEWKCFTLTKQQLYDLGVESLNGLQISLELKDPTNPEADGGWCPVTFTTYVDNFSVGLVSEPTAKAEGVLLDFANYRDLDNITSSYTTYNFYDLQYTRNGVGSMKVSADGKWPTMKLGAGFGAYDLTDVKYLCMDVIVPTIAENSFVQIGINDKNYQKITTAGEWVTVKLPIGALTTLEGVEIDYSRKTNGAYVNLGTLYVGKVYFENYEYDPEAATHVKAGNVLYDFYDRTEATKLTYGTTGEKVIMADGTRAAKFVKTNSPWGFHTLPAEADERFDVTKVNYLYMTIYPQETATSQEIRITYKTYNYDSSTQTGSWGESHTALNANAWNFVRIPVNANTPKLSRIEFSLQKKNASGTWLAIGAESGDALYIGEIGVLSNTVAYGDYTGTFETSMDLGIFYAMKADYKILTNTTATYVKQGTTSLKLQAQPQWPRYYFTEAFLLWLEEKGYTSFTLDIYLASTSSNSVIMTEGLWAKSSPTNDEWVTVTITTANLRTKMFGTENKAYLQFNKSVDTTLSAYVDNMTFVKA